MNKEKEIINIKDYPIRPLKSIIKFIIIFSLLFFLIFLGLIINNWVYLLIIIFLIGFLLQYPYNAMHDCIHNNFVNNKIGNEFFGIFFGTIIFLNYNLFKAYHLEHHRNTFGKSDPEPTDQLITSFKRYIFELFIPLFFIYNWKESFEVFRNRLPKYYRINENKKKINRDSLILLVWLFIVLILTYFYSYYIILFYWIPLYFSYILDFFFLLPEHYNFEMKQGINWVNSRTTTSNWFVRTIVCNINYHVEHHLWQTIPEYYLSDVHKRVKKKIKYLNKSYILFHYKLIKSYFGENPGVVEKN